MGKLIEVIFDPIFKPNKLSMPIAEFTQDQYEHNESIKEHEIDQTKVYGIQVPLIAINDIFIDFNNIYDFSLKSVDVFPTIQFTVLDKYGLIESVQSPGMDNEIRIDVLPKFDNVYKKIELSFYINSIKINGNCITLTGLYKYPDLTDTKLESFGKVNTYDLFNNIANVTKLGFATNISQNIEDSRYVYCDYKSYNDILNREINFGGNNDEIYEYWIDFWNYINLVNIKERYYSIDKDEEMLIWVAKQTQEVNEIDVECIKTVALLTNHPASSTSELYINAFDISNKSGSYVAYGSDNIYSIYENNKFEYLDYDVIDGDIEKDIFYKFEYIGEVYGEHNYLKQKCLRNALLKKIKSESIKVSLKSPILGLNRGDKVNIVWFKNNDFLLNKLSELSDQNIINEYDSIQTNIPLPSSLDDTKNIDNGVYMIDKSISGQYLITGVELNFKNNQWQYNLILNRPADQKPKIIKTNG